MTAHSTMKLSALIVVLSMSAIGAPASAADSNNPSGNSTPVPTPTNNMFSNPLNQPIPPATSPYTRYGVSPIYRGARGVPTQQRK